MTGHFVEFTFDDGEIELKTINDFIDIEASIAKAFTVLREEKPDAVVRKVKATEF